MRVINEIRWYATSISFPSYFSVGGRCGRDLHETQFTINVIANTPSIPGPLVYVEAGKWYIDSAKKFIDTQEVAM